jgi:hypothetical protein
MDKALPNKWIRKAVYDAFNGTVVDGETINVYDQRVTNDINSDTPDYYVLMTTQTNDVDKRNKCEWFWESSILLDVFTRYELPGNYGSRLLADNILEDLKDATNNLTLDVASGLEIVVQTDSFPANLTSTTKKENIFRNFLRIELFIK